MKHDTFSLPPKIKAIYDKRLNAMSKYLDENNILNKGIENELTHNPMINDHIGDTLVDIEAVVDFIAKFTLEPSLNTSRRLAPYEQTVIQLLSSSAIKALQFEQERASYIMFKAKS